VFKVLSGGVLAQLLNFLSFPIIASWYGPAAFGDYAVFAFFIAFVPMLMTLRMEMAIMTDPDEVEIERLILLSFINSIFLLAICIAVSLFFRESLRIEILVISFTSFLLSLQNMATSLANLKEKYWILAISKLIFPIFFLLLVWATRSKDFPFPLATAHMFSALLVVLFILKASSYKIKLTSLARLKEVLEKYKGYIKYDLPSGVLNASALLLPAYLIGILFDEESAGLYFLAFKLVLSPLGALTMAVGYVYRREAVREFKQYNNFKNSTRKMFFFLSFLATLMLFVYYFVGPFVFGIFFKEDWLAAIPIISILMPMFAMKLVASPLSFSFYIVEKLKLDLYGQLIFIVFSVLAIVCGYILNEFILSVYFIAVLSGLVYFGYALTSIQFSKGRLL
jgi:O-antigen/teichoic acid export membrane protein